MFDAKGLCSNCGSTKCKQVSFSNKDMRNFLLVSGTATVSPQNANSCVTQIVIYQCDNCNKIDIFIIKD